MISRLLQIIYLFCRRALYKRLYSAKETYDLRSLLIVATPYTSPSCLYQREYSMCVHIYTRIYAMHIHIYTRIYVYTYMHTSIYTCTYICAKDYHYTTSSCPYWQQNLRVYKYVYTYICVHLYMHAHISIYIYMYVYIYTCMHI